MDFFEVLEERASMRSFLEKDVEEEKLRKILKAANGAPSAGNLQAYKIVVVTHPDRKKELAEASLRQGFVSSAPVVLVFFADPKKSTVRYGEKGKYLYCIQDASIACCYAQLAAVALGLSSVWVGAFDDKKVKRASGAKGNLRPVAVLPIGYAGEKPFKTKRKSLGDMVSYI